MTKWEIVATIYCVLGIIQIGMYYIWLYANRHNMKNGKIVCKG